MQDEQTRYFFDVQVGGETTLDVHGAVLPSADEAVRDAVEIAAAMMNDAPEIGRPVTVTVRKGGETLVRVRGLLTMEHAGPAV